MKNKFFCLLSDFSTAATQSPDEIVVAGGRYYAGEVFGQHDYEWALKRGYAFSVGCNGAAYEDCRPADTDNGAHPVTPIEWSGAVIFANALSEKAGLRPVYLNNKGVPARDSSRYGFAQDARANGFGTG